MPVVSPALASPQRVRRAVAGRALPWRVPVTSDLSRLQRERPSALHSRYSTLENHDNEGLGGENRMNPDSDPRVLMKRVPISATPPPPYTARHESLMFTLKTINVQRTVPTDGGELRLVLVIRRWTSACCWSGAWLWDTPH